MTELKMSDFKMTEKPPFELPPPKALTELIIGGLREEEKTYGPVFTARFIKHALEFEAQKTGEKPPQDIKTLDQLAEYLVSKADKYPTPYCAAMYAQVKTEGDLQGRAGAGTRVGTISTYRKIVDGSSGKKREIDVDGVLTSLRRISIEMKFSPYEWGYKKNENESVDILWPKCPFLDACRLAHREGLLTRLDGKLQCGGALAACQYLKLSTGYEWDYELLDFDKPHCIARCFML